MTFTGLELFFVLLGIGAIGYVVGLLDGTRATRRIYEKTLEDLRPRRR